MIIPNAETINEALDQLMQLPDGTTREQGKELRKAMNASFDESFVLGFNLGLQTGRVILQKSPILKTESISPEAIL
jgi:hypothetical protein